jgi:Putative transposase
LESLQKALDSGKLQFFAALESLRDPNAFAQLQARMKAREWVVYVKRPFAGPKQVLDYVGRYTHRVAISNNRLLDIENGQVRFQWKDYRHQGQSKAMTLSADEFIRRFLLHLLPDGFQRIRYYGFLANRYRKEKLERCRCLIGMPAPANLSIAPPADKDYHDRYEELTGRSLHQCPQCGQGRMLVVKILAPTLCKSAPDPADSS